MNLLIVDDEVLAVEGLKVLVDWERFGIRKLFTAFNMQEAQRILLKDKVDILLCDIEMPMGSGLDLLRWIREGNYPAECIFLSCHTDFSYAREAIALQGTDYLVKPVGAPELRKTLEKASAAVRRRQERELVDRIGKKRDVIKNAFWRELFFGRDTGGREGLARLAAAAGVVMRDDRYAAVLVDYREAVDGKLWSAQSVDFILENVAYDMFHLEESNSYVVMRPGKYGCFAVESGRYHESSALLGQLGEFRNWIGREYGFQLSCYLSEFVPPEELPGQLPMMYRCQAANVWEEGRLFLCSGNGVETLEYRVPDWKLLRILLAGGEKEALLSHIRLYLEGYRQEGGPTPAILGRFLAGFRELVERFCQEQGNTLAGLLEDKEYMALWERAQESVAGLLSLCEKMANFSRGGGKPGWAGRRHSGGGGKGLHREACRRGYQPGDARQACPFEPGLPEPAV